jgi:hypothetical protein
MLDPKVARSGVPGWPSDLAHERRAGTDSGCAHTCGLVGRRLTRGETVHHRNGVRDDNSPENLDLGTRPQPAGIRASDAIAWAHEVLNRYGHSVAQEGCPPCADP